MPLAETVGEAMSKALPVLYVHTTEPLVFSRAYTTPLSAAKYTRSRVMTA